MGGALEMLVKLAATGAAAGKVTIEKVTELGEAIGNQLTNAIESVGDSVGDSGASADKTMAYIMDKATPGVGHQKDQALESSKNADMGMGM